MVSRLGRSPFDNPAAVVGDLPVPQGTVVVGGNKEGSVTLNGATPVTVVNAAVDANSIIIFTLKTVHGTVGAYPSVKTKTAGTGFTVAGTALDTSEYNYIILEKA